MNTDRLFLADGISAAMEGDPCGVNNNMLVVGVTGGGKTMSAVEPMLLHMHDTSVVVTLSKRELANKYMEHFSDLGYRVIDMNLADLSQTEVMYDPFDNMKTDADVTAFAEAINCTGEAVVNNGSVDGYWRATTNEAIKGLIYLLKENEASYGTILSPLGCEAKACMGNLWILYQNLRFEESSKNNSCSTLDNYFAAATSLNPKSDAARHWKAVQGLALKTMSCVSSELMSSLGSVLSKEVGEAMLRTTPINFAEIGQEKTALFITVSPIGGTMTTFMNVMYSDLFRTLFMSAEHQPGGVLPVPVHVICDDFACGGRINRFDEYISVFRAKKISVTLLLQSESQLECMYGQKAAQTIINNCCYYLYMGGMDYDTCYSISRKTNMPLDDVMFMPIGKVIVMRLGHKPVMAYRYQTLEDEEYKKLISLEPAI